MVSEKVVIILIVVAILLSVVSIAVTISTVNTKMIPEIEPNKVIIPDDGKGKVSLVINPQSAPPESSVNG